MDYNTLAVESELPSSLEEVDAHSVYAAFEQITDGRCKRGIRYSVALILSLIVLAKLTGEPKLSGVSQWARLRGTWLNEVLHMQRTQWPAASTYTYVLERLDEAEVTRVMRASPDAGGNEPTLWRRTQPFSHPRGSRAQRPYRYGWQNHARHPGP